jgi:hypothetical protein
MLDLGPFNFETGVWRDVPMNTHTMAINGKKRLN